MGFQHMSKAARRRIQSLGGKASRRGRKRSVRRNGEAAFTTVQGLFEEIRKTERERIKAAILKVIG